MDKPLDFSMGSSKDQVNKCKVEEVQPVTSKIQEDISSNGKEHDFSNTLQKEMVLNAKEYFTDNYTNIDIYTIAGQTKLSLSLLWQIKKS